MKSLIASRFAGEDKRLKNLIKALAEDYGRREAILLSGDISRRMRMEYAYLNSKILDGALEIADARLAPIFIKEIGEGVGYAKSEIDCMSEVTYKNYKTEISANIARKLYLWE